MGISGTIDAITLFVSDLGRAKAFYLDVLEARLVFEDADSAAFRFGSVIVNLLVETAAADLIAPSTPGGSAGGARFQLTVGVDDVDAASAELAGRGVRLLNGPMDRPWGLRTACFADVDGHIWELAQALG